MTRLFRALLALCTLATAAPALAHGLLVSVNGEGSSVAGRVYYSDGTAGAGEFVELRDLTDPARPAASGPTDAKGNFRFPGVSGHRYAIIAHGEEGHTTEMRLTLTNGERGRLADEGAGSERFSLADIPAWAVIGGVLLLSAGPAVWMRQRQRRAQSDTG